MAVLGTGLMGSSIATLLRKYRYPVRCFDAGSRPSVQGDSGLVICDSIGDAVRDAFLVIEAVFEDIGVKQDVYREVEQHNTIAPIASNTSSLVPSLLSAAMDSPERLVVAHFFNPADLVPLVELVPHPGSSADAVETVRCVLESMDRTVISLDRECPGFVANRLQAAIVREALALVAEGIATPEMIDTAVTSCLGARWAVAGPLRTIDSAGLDVWQAICAQLFPILSAVNTRSRAIDELVSRGRLGMKAGEGFFEYTEEDVAAHRSRLELTLRRPTI
ncbi:3-hydroxyacyl-CoA dehydrogenase family protein [Kribbella sp. NPDC003505]|uniref:3-hydroxyacyl-CoA dehydrogenase family protein n=1 Tax=Kribbella sp. NPDC003505 TaxID=3154448 RepID=UPI0033BF3D44